MSGSVTCRWTEKFQEKLLTYEKLCNRILHVKEHGQEKKHIHLKAAFTCKFSNVMDFPSLVTLLMLQQNFWSNPACLSGCCWTY